MSAIAELVVESSRDFAHDGFGGRLVAAGTSDSVRAATAKTLPSSCSTTPTSCLGFSKVPVFDDHFEAFELKSGARRCLTKFWPGKARVSAAMPAGLNVDHRGAPDVSLADAREQRDGEERLHQQRDGELRVGVDTDLLGVYLTGVG
jgi:hypothetical protein